MTYSFDPATAGVGTHTLTYSFTDTNGCSDSASDDVEVFALPIVTFTAPADICLNAGVQAGLGGGLPTGGVYSGSGVTDDGNGMTYSFDPAAAGTGVHTLTYDFTDTNGCTGSASDDIEVFNSLTATFTAPADLCENAGIQTGLSGGMPIAGLGDTGIYSGSGVNDDGNNMTYSFDPAVAGVGTHTITYTFTSADGCTGSASDDIEVFGVPAATFTVDYISGCEGNGTCAGTSTLIAPIDGSGIFKFYDADPNAGGATLLAGPASSYDPMTTAATSPQSIWVVECLPGICDSEAEVVVVTIVTNPTPTISVPTLPTSLSCEMAVSYSPPTATFTNGLTGDCENSGSGIIGTVTSNFTACGGSVSVTYSGTDNCGNTITAGPFMIPVDPAPAATLTVPSLPTSLSCEMADTYVALDATYDNGLTGICENSGNISATISDNWTTCGGVISVTYSGTDDCGNALSAGPFTITVDPAPVPTVTEPTYPSVLSCIDAENFVAPDATYTNGLTGNCNISGVLPAGVDNNWDACGGTIVLHYFGVDDCGNFLSIPSITITVQAAPIPTVSFPILPNSISCENAGTYIPPSAPFDNGLSGACNISGNIPALVNYFYDACGGTIEVIYSGEDDCGRNLAAVVTVIPVDPAPAPTVNLPTYPSELTCSEAEALDGIFAPYNNGLIGDCEISGLLEAELIMDVTAGAGGTVTVVYSGEDDCGNILSATPIVIPVLPASIPTIQLPDDPDFLYCWDANNFTPGIATFSNGENGFCENSGELDLTGFEEYWDNCDGGYILLQYSGLDNAGNFLQTDLYKIPVIPDAFAPQGVCVDLNIKLDDIKDTPSPDELGDYQNQIASSYFETCGNVNVTLVTDSGVPECGLDGTFERIYEFEITDDCGNSAGICSVTFSGYCNPLYCTLPQDFYSSPDESFAGLSSLELVDLLISSGTDPIVIGMQECGLTLNNAACIQAGLTGQGPSISLPDDFQFNCGDPISNNLVNQIITTTLNIRYNATLNNGGIDFGNFQIDATCMYIPQSISTQLPTNATVNDLIDLANNFIGCQCTNTCGFSQSVNAELTGIFLGLNSRFNKCHVPGPCFLDGNQNPGGGIVFEPDMKEKIKLGGGTTSVEEILENKNSKLEVILYPNPAEDIINIKLNEGIGKSCFIEIFDARGVKVGEKSYSRLNQNIINFDIQEYHQGIYWMTIKLNDFSQVTKRFVIKK